MKNPPKLKKLRKKREQTFHLNTWSEDFIEPQKSVKDSLTHSQHYMVQCHENAYSPKNLSLFAFNIEGYWGLIKKKLKEMKRQMFLSMSLHLWKCFVLLQGVQKICQIIVFFSSQYWVKLGPKKDNHELLRLKKENNYSTIFGAM